VSVPSRLSNGCALCVLALSLAWTPSARAGDDAPSPGEAPPTGDEAAPVEAKSETKTKADALFDEAFKALDAGDWDTACAKFRESMRYDTSVSTQLNIARCNEHEGKLVQAWADFNRARFLNRDTKDPARRAALFKAIDEAAMKVEPRLARVRILVEDPPPGLYIERAGEVLARGAAGAPVPFDPGTHEIVISAPGHLTQRTTVTLEEGETRELKLKLVEGEDHSAQLEAPLPAPQPGSPDQPEPEGTPNWVWLAGGVGVLALGGAAVFAAVTVSARAELSDNCTDVGGTFQCGRDQYNQEDLDGLVSEANTGAGAAIGLGALGVTGVIVAIVGFTMTDSSSNETSGSAWYIVPSVGLDRGGFIAGARF
jgi:hypothetical protein